VGGLGVLAQTKDRNAQLVHPSVHTTPYKDIVNQSNELRLVSGLDLNEDDTQDETEQYCSENEHPLHMVFRRCIFCKNSP
jgi:hypothetical protein